MPDDNDSDRVFYSTTGKASTHTIGVNISKLTPSGAATGKPDIKPEEYAWNPELLEFSVVGLQPDDDPETWAMFLHQQRFSNDYRDGLGLPLILHLAALTSRYALPHDDELDNVRENDRDDSTDVDEAPTEPE